MSEDLKRNAVVRAFGRTPTDLSAWSDVCSAVADYVGAKGGLLLGAEAENNQAILPHSHSMSRVVESYHSGRWNIRDLRAERGSPIAAVRGYVTDYDIVTREEMRSHPYYGDLIMPAGLQWFAATMVTVGNKSWALSLQRTPDQGPFQQQELERLAGIRDQLRLAVRRANALAARRLKTIEDTLSTSDRGFATIDAGGKLTFMDAAAEALLAEGELLMEGRLVHRVQPYSTMLNFLVESVIRYGEESAVPLPPPLKVRTAAGRSIIIDAIPMPRDFQSAVAGAAAIITVRTSAESTLLVPVLRASFGLTVREAEIAGQLAAGHGIEAISTTLGVSVATVRQHLKAIFRKIGVRRQGDLVAKLSSLV